jgi:hypothetical protein
LTTLCQGDAAAGAGAAGDTRKDRIGAAGAIRFARRVWIAAGC